MPTRSYTSRGVASGLAFLCAASVAMAQSPTAALEYPTAERVSQIDVYHGVEVSDPYRWLEELESNEARHWVETQNALAIPFLEGIARREEIKQRIAELWNYERYRLPLKKGGRYFYRRNTGLQDQDVLYVTDSLDAEPRVLIDPNRLREDATISLATYSVSPDGSRIAYARSDAGSDWKTWRVRDVETGDDYDEVLDFIKFTNASWARDGSGFYYSRYPVGPDGKGDGSVQVSVYFHRVGSDQSQDDSVYAIPDNSSRNPSASVTEDGRYLIIGVSDGYKANAVYYRSMEPGSEVVRLLDEWDALYRFMGNDGTTFFFRTNNGAPRYRVIAIDIEEPAPSAWREVVPEAEETLERASYVGEHIVARYLEHAHSLVKVYSTRGEVVHQVDLPGIGSASGFSGDEDDPETFYSFSSYTSPPTIYRYNVETGEQELFHRVYVGVDFDAYETKQVFYTSRDGTRVPMFVTHKKGVELDGKNPTLLYGYGGFNISRTPRYSTSRMVWMEMGGVLAIANLRGGGEYGEEWHKAGTKLNKQNVFDDFIAAAEWLIESGYTSTPKLAIQGGSNGGLLVGAVITQRPELFGAALPAVGVLDMLRYHLPSHNARQWSSDYGLSENEDEFRALYAYSPLHNVKEGTCYPPTLVTTADHDDRVVPWHSYKFGATLQYAQGCDNPIVVRVETRAGHGAGKPTWMRIDNIADHWAFLTEMLGMNRPTVP